jgi:mono/diheme cytochrome c family protein
VQFIATSAVVAIIACRANTEETRDFERMRRQQRTAAYQSSRVLASGMSMQLPPRGTISREELLLGPRLVSGKQLGAAGATAFVHDVPVASSPQMLAAGARLFAASCAPCHGANGTTAGVVGANLRPPPPSLMDARISAIPAGQMFDVVSNGVRSMPPYAWALSVPERWAVVAYVKSLQGTRGTQGTGGTRP